MNTSSASSSGAVGEGLPPATSPVGVTESSIPIQKEQGADKPTDAPTGGQQDAVKTSKEEAEEAIFKRDPNDHSGEPMRMHDKTGGIVSDTSAGNDLSGEAIKARGTGEKHVKSTGLAADGGDFDATKPGAGAEASRKCSLLVRPVIAAPSLAVRFLAVVVARS